MPHDKTTIHVSHYKRSPTWQSAVAPEDRSWLLFIDVTGAPHLYLATETKNGEGHTVTTYAPCVRAMLFPEETEAAPLPPGVAAVHTLKIDVERRGDLYLAGSGALAGEGATVRDAVVRLLDYLDEIAARKPAEAT